MKLTGNPGESTPKKLIAQLTAHSNESKYTVSTSKILFFFSFTSSGNNIGEQGLEHLYKAIKYQVDAIVESSPRPLGTGLMRLSLQVSGSKKRKA